MRSGYFFPAQFGMKSFIKGQLEQKEGTVVLRTTQGVFPVKVEGATVPFGEELVFRLLREEPGLVVLSPYRLETLGEALPYFKELFAGAEDLGRKLLYAAVQENLPLTRDVIFNLKKGLITAEQQWGVKIHPRTVAFLQARALPLTPRTLLWALYSLFPSVQRVLWQQTNSRPPLLPYLAQEKEGNALETEEEKMVATTKDEPVATVFREAVAFLQQQARHDPTLPQLIFYYFPNSEAEVRWVGRGHPGQEEAAGDGEKKASDSDRSSYAFCLDYQSSVLGPLQIVGLNGSSGLTLKVRAESPVLKRNLFAGLQAYLQAKGWSVQAVEFEEYREEEAADSPPLRIDGWI